VIRPATTGDLAAVQRVGVAAGERFRSVDDPRVARCADDPPVALDELATACDGGRLLVAEVDGDVAGFLLLEVLDAGAHVEEVAVHPDHEGGGLGSALLDAASAWAGERGMGTVTLTTFRDVAWNRPFYERRGFRVLADDEIGPGLRATREHEASIGLDPSIRVAMSRPV
jgi:GNAT superfamily N-acetyltransferase